MAISNTLYFHVIDEPALQGVGWEVRVLDYKDWDTRALNSPNNPVLSYHNLTVASLENVGGPALCIISQFETVSISPEISAIGAGSITLDLDSDLFQQTLGNGAPASYLLEHEHLWQVWQDGILRFEFLGQTVTMVDESDDETRIVTVAGPGGADVLRWGKIFTPEYPATVADDDLEGGYYEFIRTPMMAAWLVLLADCKKRGTLTFVRPTFTDLVDSAGEPWEDTPAPIPTTTEGGTTILAGDVLFDSDSYSLKASASAAIVDMVAKMATDPTVTCVGHTDSTNTIPYNQTLSERRAKAVGDRIKTLRPGATIKTSGKGELQPVATNATAAGRAKNRRVTVSYTQTVAVDTSATDSVYDPETGQDLLATLKTLAGEDPEQVAPIRVEWYMRPGLLLDVRRQFGRHREDTVIFYDGSTAMIGKSRERVREEIRNFIAVMDEFSVYTTATDATSIADWHQREDYQDRYVDTFLNARDDLAQTALAMGKDEVNNWTIKVPPFAPGRTVFVDYNLGDWVGVTQWNPAGGQSVQAFRVMAITIAVDNDGNTDLELTLKSQQEYRLRKLTERITSIENRIDNGVYTYITDNPPNGAKIGDIWIKKTSGIY